MRKSSIPLLVYLCLTTIPKNIFAQELDRLPVFEMDWRNLDFIFYPDTTVKKNRVKTVNYSIEKQGEKRIHLKSSNFDTNGYLISQKNYDRFYENSGEQIFMTYQAGIFKIIRQAKKQDLLNAGNGTYSIFECYIPLMKFIRSVASDKIIIESIYKFGKDSILDHTTTINGRLIDSGSFNLIFPKSNRDFEKNVTTTMDTTSNRDTLIYSKKTNVKGYESQSEDFYFFVDKNIVKKEHFEIHKEKRVNTQSILYKYDRLGIKISEEYWVHQNTQLFKRIYFGYDKLLDTYINVEEIFDSDRNKSTCNIYDVYGNVLEENESFWLNKIIQQKVIYNYIKIGLKKEIKSWRNGELFMTDTYEYKFY